MRVAVCGAPAYCGSFAAAAIARPKTLLARALDDSISHVVPDEPCAALGPITDR